MGWIRVRRHRWTRPARWCIDIWLLLGESAWLLVIAALAAGAYALDAPVALRAALGLPSVLFIPGYFAVTTLFPARHGLDGLERIALAFGLSFVTTPLIALVIEYSRWKLHGDSIVPVLLGVTLLLAGMALLRRAQLKPDERYIPQLPSVSLVQSRAWDRLSWLAVGLLSASILMMIVGAGVILASRMQVEPVTEIAIYNGEGKPEFYPRRFGPDDPVTVILEVVNREGQAARYTIRVTLDGREIGASGEFTLSDGEVWRQPLRLDASLPREKVAVTFNLYRVGDDVNDMPFRQLRLFVGGDAALPDR